MTKVSPEENLGDDRRLDLLLRAHGKRVVYDAEHFFDALARGLRLRARLPAGGGCRGCRERHPLRHQRLQPAGAGGRGDRRGGRRALAATSRSASTRTTTPSARSPTRSPRWRPGARLVQGTINGFGERCGNANLVSILPALQLKMGYECVRADRLRRLTETAHFIDELCNLSPGPGPAIRRSQRIRAQGRHARGWRAGRRAHLRAHRPGAGGQRATSCSPSCRARGP